jgi:Phytanoyl-CoA dioxygenase (PhyH)
MLRYFRELPTVPTLSPRSTHDAFEAPELSAISQINTGWFRKILVRITDYSFTTAVVYALARFYSLRWIVRAYRRLARTKSPYSTSASARVIGGPPVQEVLSELHSSSWCVGPALDSHSVSKLLDFANDCEFTSRALPADTRFRLRDRTATEQRYQKSIALADAAAPMESEIVRGIAHDRTLHDIAKGYFGYPVTKVDARILASFATNTSAAERLAQKQTIFHHYDLDDFHMLIFNFYLTHVDENSGAHVLLPGTHGWKRARHLFSSLNFSDAEMACQYPDRPAVAVCGKPGFGFVKDPFCFHKAPPPKTGDRYMLQLRFM